MQRSILPLLACLGLAWTSTAGAYQPVPLIEGAAAPDFDLMGIDGNRHTLADATGEKATVLIFTTNHCPDAIANVDRMIALVDQFKDQGVKFTAINSNSPDGLHLPELGWTVYDDGYEDMKLIAVDSGFNLPYLYDGDTQDVAKAYGAVATPHVFVFDADLKLRYNGRMDDARRALGPAEKNEARDAIAAVLAGKKVEVVKTRPIGCTIKWKEKAAKVAVENEKWKKHPVTVELTEAPAIAKLTANKGRTGLRLFNVWSTTCGPCVLEFPELAEVYRQYSWQEFEFITISLDPPKSKDSVTKFLKGRECGLSPRTKPLVEEDGRTTNNFIFQGDTEDLVTALDPQWNGALPHTILVGENGKVLFRQTGDGLDFLALKKAIVAKVWAEGE